MFGGDETESGGCIVPSFSGDGTDEGPIDPPL